MIHRVAVRSRREFGDPHAESVLHQIRELGFQTVSAVRSEKLFFLYGPLDAEQAHRVAEGLLADPVLQDFRLDAGADGEGDATAVIEVHLKPGVMDPEAASTAAAIAEMDIPVESVRTGRRYELTGQLDEAARETIARRLLANPVIEDIYATAHTPAEVHGQRYTLEVREVPIRDLDEQGLQTLSDEGHLFLNLSEMQAIRDHYRQIGREPRDVELETLAQTWSEHCVHKTFRSDVHYVGEPIPGWPNEADGVTAEGAGAEVELRIPNLIKTTVFAATRKLDLPWCLSVFEDNAGVIAFDDDHAVCFKVETHNHPSAIEPYGGASTGIGGVIRDPLGTGAGAKPFASTDVFCFGSPQMPLSEVPKGMLHPRRLMRGVVCGVRDYGNRMGIPTVNGAVYFDDRYLGNPLVFCGTAGLLPAGGARKCSPQAGDVVVVAGGRTGRDGIHGATFSSGELTSEHESEFSHAVQIGNAITEKKLLDVIIQARDRGLYSAITDCGAGGLSSAVGEMGETLGAEVHLDRVPLKYAGLRYDEIWISEAQERMVLAVAPDQLDELLELFASEEVEATAIGTFGTEGSQLRLRYDGQLVGELDMDFLHNGLPRPAKRAEWKPAHRRSPAPAQRDNYNDALLAILAAPNVASKEWIIRQYDHEVQGGSVIKPLVGAAEDGPGDASVVRPVLASDKGVALSVGMNPKLGDLDPYQSACHAVDEALRNAVSVGGRLDRTAILDNFCWGNCNKPDRMGSFVHAAKACHDAALAYGTPFVSGKDSLNNEFRTADGEVIAIPPTLLISAISIIDDVSRCVTADAKEPGNVLFLLGRTGPCMGGSHYLLAEGLETGTDVPAVDMAANRKVMEALQQAMAAGLVRACHDPSEGGLAVAAAEMAFAGGLGVRVDLQAVPAAADTPAAAKLFAEDAGRFLVEVSAENYDAFCRTVADCPFGEVGRVTDSGRIVLADGPRTLVDVDIEQAKAAWSQTL